MSVEDIDFLKENCIKESIIVLIDSKERDLKRFPEPGEFQVDFVEPFSFVYGIEILDTTIPRTMFMMEEGLNNLFVYNCGSWYNLFSSKEPNVEQHLKFATQDYASADAFVNAIVEQIEVYESEAGLNIANSNFEISMDFDSNPEVSHSRDNQSHPIVRFISKVPFFINATKSTCKDTFGFNSLNTHSTENSLSLRSMIGPGKNRNVDMSNRYKTTLPSSKINLVSTEMNSHVPDSLTIIVHEFDPPTLETNNVFTINITQLGRYVILFHDSNNNSTIKEIKIQFGDENLSTQITDSLTFFQSTAVGEHTFTLTSSEEVTVKILLESELKRYYVSTQDWYVNDSIEYKLEYKHDNDLCSQSSLFNFEIENDNQQTIPIFLEIKDTESNIIITFEATFTSSSTKRFEFDIEQDREFYLFIFEHGKTYTLSLITTNEFNKCSIGLLEFYHVSEYINDELFISKPWVGSSVTETTYSRNDSFPINYVLYSVKITTGIDTAQDLSREQCVLKISSDSFFDLSDHSVDIHMKSEYDSTSNEWVFTFVNENFDDNFITNIYTTFFNQINPVLFSTLPLTTNYTLTIGLKKLERQDNSDNYFTIVSPGMLNLGVENYIILRCDEIEQHLRGSHYYDGLSPGLGVLNMTVQGFAESKNEFYAINYKEFHPIGRLSKMKFRFERKFDKKVYNFRNVNLHFLMKIKYYRPYRKPVFKKSILNPEYNPDYVGYINNTYSLEEPLSDDDDDDDEDDDEEQVTSGMLLARENELLQDLIDDEFQ
jgi:hypothetical protein